MLSKLITAIEFSIFGARTASFLGISFQITRAMIKTAMATKAGINSFFNPNVTVISLEVMGKVYRESW